MSTYKTIPQAAENVAKLNKRAEAKAQQMVLHKPADADEAYVAMMSHAMALTALAKAEGVPVDFVQRLMTTAHDTVQVMQLRKVVADAS